MSAAKKSDGMPSLDPVDLVAILDPVLREFYARVASFLGKLPAGAKPNIEALNALFSQAMAAFPGTVAAGVSEVQKQVVELALKGKGPVKHDPSALA